MERIGFAAKSTAGIKIECSGVAQETRGELIVEDQNFLRLRAPIGRRFEGFGSSLGLSPRWLAVFATGTFANDVLPSEVARPGRVFVYPRRGTEVGNPQELRPWFPHPGCRSPSKL